MLVVLQPQNCRNNFGLGFSPFARHYLGNHYCFLFLRVLRCFSSPGLPPRKDIQSSTGWVVPFGNPRIKRLCAATRGLSQLITSFIASKIQGILHMPLFAFLNCNYWMFKKFLNKPTYFYDSWFSFFSIRQRSLWHFCQIFLYVHYKTYQICLNYLVENIGVEPMTSCVQGRRSSQLS